MLLALSHAFLIELVETVAQEAACSPDGNVLKHGSRSERAWVKMANQVLDGARKGELGHDAHSVAGQMHCVLQ